MITSVPSVQKYVSRIKRFVCLPARTMRFEKHAANRHYRRHLAEMTREFQRDADLFDDEPFDVPSLSSWDLW